MKAAPPSSPPQIAEFDLETGKSYLFLLPGQDMFETRALWCVFTVLGFGTSARGETTVIVRNILTGRDGVLENDGSLICYRDAESAAVLAISDWAELFPPPKPPKGK